MDQAIFAAEFTAVSSKARSLASATRRSRRRLRLLKPAQQGVAMNVHWPESISFRGAPSLFIGLDAVALVSARRVDPAAEAPLASFDEPSVIAAISGVLGKHSGAVADVVIDAALAQFWMLPFSDELQNDARWQSYACSHFDQAFGPADEWSIRVAIASPPKDRLAAALPRSLLAGLQQAFGRRPRSVRIDALERLERLVRSTPRFAGAAVDVGPGGGWIFLFQGGTLRRVWRWRTIDEDAETVAANLLHELRSEWSRIDDGALPELRIASSPGDVSVVVDHLRDRPFVTRVATYG